MKKNIAAPPSKAMEVNVPQLAIVESNTLAVMGLKQLLESAMPFARIQVFGTFGEFESNNPAQFMHFFVSMQIVLANRTFFFELQTQDHRTDTWQRLKLTDERLPQHLRQCI